MHHEPLNIVLLMADQWRWDTLFAPGHICRTPNLDRFAAQSQVFPNAFTPYPLCCPARGALFTGLWPHQTGLMDNVQAGSYYPHGKLRPDLPTYLERLRDKAGYATAYAGKWHMGTGTAAERGIEMIAVSDGGAPGQRGEGCPRPTCEGDTLWPFYGAFSGSKTRDQCAIEAGIDQIRALAADPDGRPFVSVVSTWGPHFPHIVPQAYADFYADLPADFVPENYAKPFDETYKPRMQSRPARADSGTGPCQNTRPLTPEDWRKTCQHYWAYCTYLDAQFGRVLAALDELGIADHTVVAFAADHGEMLGAHGNFDKGPYFYEEVMRIPFIIREPLNRAPRSREGFVNLRDLFPTLIDLAGAPGVLEAHERARTTWRTDHDDAFYSYDSYHGRQFKLRGIHTARYKYAWSPHDLSELYDLERDPGERLNLADDPGAAPVRAELHSRLQAWMDTEGDYLNCARHLPVPGTYIDGRAAEEQHDPGWSDADWAWFRQTRRRDQDNE